MPRALTRLALITTFPASTKVKLRRYGASWLKAGIDSKNCTGAHLAGGTEGAGFAIPEVEYQKIVPPLIRGLAEQESDQRQEQRRANSRSAGQQVSRSAGQHDPRASSLIAIATTGAITLRQHECREIQASSERPRLRSLGTVKRLRQTRSW